MDLHEALTQISEIRQQVARTETFRGFKSTPVAFSGVLAWTAALVQHQWMTAPSESPEAYLCLWVGAAVVSMAFTGVFMVLHCWQSPSALTKSNTLLTVGQFAPSVVAGSFVTFAIYRHAPQCLWLLPGLWPIFLSLGVFASYRLLPRETFWIGVYYLGAGLASLMFAQDEWAFSPWAMGLTFGVGQFLSAAVLYWTLERADGEK